MNAHEELPDDIAELVQKHNDNHDIVDNRKSYEARTKAQAENRDIRDKLVEDIGVPGHKVNELVDEDVNPQTFKEEAKALM